jgi:hypothetical protein
LGNVVTQIGVAAGKPNAEAVYSAQAGALVYQAVSVAFLQQPGRTGNVLVTVTFQLDRRARVQNLVIIPRKGGQWAEDTARKAVDSVRFVPAPKKVFDGFGKELINVRADVGLSGPS